MQIKEFEALSLKECLQRVRDDMGPEAVILETRKFRKGGVMGMGAKDAVCIVAATGITVQNDLPSKSGRPAPRSQSEPARVKRPALEIETGNDAEPSNGFMTSASQVPASAARAAYTRSAKNSESGEVKRASTPTPAKPAHTQRQMEMETNALLESSPQLRSAQSERMQSGPALLEVEAARFTGLERAMQEIREGLLTLKRQQEAQERKFTAVVSTVIPRFQPLESEIEAEFPLRFPELRERLLASGVAPALAEELLDSLPDFDAWSSPAQKPLAESALRDLLSRRVPCAGPIQLTPGKLKAVALIGPTGVGKTTTIAKIAAHFSLVEGKKVALLTVDTYRIAAVEQLKTYSQIIDIPIGVAYSQAEVLPAIAEFADYDLLLIDTAGRSQKNIMQVGELKALLESLDCETHLALAAPVKEEDMVESVRRFSAACVDRIIFTKLDETGSYGTLLNVSERTGIPISYMTSGQKVPEDIETADGRRLAELILGE